jgi:hypothetical protein
MWQKRRKAETCWAYLGLMRAVSLSAGMPLALYSDRHTIFHSPREPTPRKSSETPSLPS